MLFVVLDADARDGSLGDEGRIAAAPAVRAEAGAAVRVDLPHIVVAMVGSSEDESRCQLLDIELHLHLVIRDGTLAFGAGLVGARLNPMRPVPGARFHETRLKVCLLGAGSRLALVIRDGDAPIVACLGSGRETVGLDEHACIGADATRRPNDIAENGIGGNLQVVAGLHHAALLALELPGEMDDALVDADRIAIILSTKITYLKGKSR